MPDTPPVKHVWLAAKKQKPRD